MRVNVYSKKDLDKAYENGKKAGVRLNLDYILSDVAIQLKDKHGMSQEEIDRLGREVSADFEATLKDELTLQEIVEAAKEEKLSTNENYIESEHTPVLRGSPLANPT